MQIKDYIKAETLEEAYQEYHKGDRILLAGGTDLMVKASGKNSYKDLVFLDINGIKELKKIKSEPAENEKAKKTGELNQTEIKRSEQTEQTEYNATEVIKIGSAVTLTELLEDPLIRKKLPLLRNAVSHVANTQVRNRATLTGNLANACPASDCIPALMMLHAKVRIGNGTEIRTAEIQDMFQDCKACLRHEGMLVRTCFYANPASKKLTLQPGEIIEEIEIPVQELSQKSCFFKLTPNRSSDMATLNLAMTGGLDEQGKIKAVDFCMGGAFPRPVCHKDLEEILLGKVPDEKAFHEYSEAAGKLLEGEEKLLADYSYKRQAVPGLIREGLMTMFLPLC